MVISHSTNPSSIQNEQFLTRLWLVLPSIRFGHEITTTPGLHDSPGLDRRDPRGAAWVRPQRCDALDKRDFARRYATGGCRADQAARQCGHDASGSAAHDVAGYRSEPGICIVLCRRTLTRRPGQRLRHSVDKSILALSPEAPHSPPTTA